MILHGNQRGGGKDLAAHLLKPENERVEVHSLRGFMARDLEGAFQESHAISRGTKCKQHLYSLSINPPKGADIEDAAFVDAIEQVETKLGLSGQPRAIVFHDKRGTDGNLRRHCHAVWCRIDGEAMKAIELPFTKLKLRDISRELHIQHDLEIPPGLMNSKDRDPRNFTLAQWQQCKRADKDPRAVKSAFQDAWSISDSKTAFAHALEERGYVLAQGRRGHVAVDHKGEVYAVSRYVGIRAKQVRTKLGEADNLPSVEQAQQQAAKRVTDRLSELRDYQHQQLETKQRQAKAEQARMRQAQADAKAKQQEQLANRQQAEEQARAARIRKGVPGLWDRFTGKRKRTLEQNQREEAGAKLRDRREAEVLRDKQTRALETKQTKAKAAQSKHIANRQELDADIKQLAIPPDPKPGKARDADREAFKAKRRTTRERPKRRFRSQPRDGPSLER